MQDLNPGPNPGPGPRPAPHPTAHPASAAQAHLHENPGPALSQTHRSWGLNGNWLQWCRQGLQGNGVCRGSNATHRLDFALPYSRHALFFIYCASKVSTTYQCQRLDTGLYGPWLDPIRHFVCSYVLLSGLLIICVTLLWMRSSWSILLLKCGVQN